MPRFLLSALALPLLAAGCARREPAAPSSAPLPRSSPEAGGTGSPRTSTGSIQRLEQVPNGVQGPNRLTVPRGFRVDVFADGLTGPRRLLPVSGPGGYDVLVAESIAGRVTLLRDADGDGRAEVRRPIVEGQNQPYGLALQARTKELFIGNTDGIVRVAYNGANKAAKPPTRVLELPPGGHWTRNLLLSGDGKKLYVAVGSSCNTCEEADERRATILEMDLSGRNARIYAAGLRNPVGMAWRPGTRELWTVVNERDNLGNDLPPDYLTRVRPGGFYGWPYALTTIEGRVEPDPSFGDRAPAKVRATTAPTVPVQAHSAALGVAWYDGKHFPAEYRGDALLAFHGSWNHSAGTGYKIVRVDFENGVPRSVTDFVRGFKDGEDVWGRPVDVAVAPDGSVLFSDDGGGKVWRVRYGK